MNTNEKNPSLSRRNFLKTSAVASFAALASGTGKIFAAGSDKIRIGLIGCGNRGTGALINCVNSAPGVELVAMGDLFKDKVDKSLDTFMDKVGDKISVTPERCFLGFDAYKKVLACDIDMIILTTPPHFRPEHLKAAVEAGKHVFMEKPAGVDPAGIRSLIATSELATQKKLSIVVGTQRHHQASYLELMKRIHNGDIGEILAAQCYWMGDYAYYPAVQRQPSWSDMEYQCRNWNYFVWLSGDHIVEQHVHNIDVINWAFNSHPVSVLGMGGREVRRGPEFGNIYDHFTCDFEYPNGVRVSSMCRQMQKCHDRVSERIVGTLGVAITDNFGADTAIIGKNPFKFEGSKIDPYVQEHTDLIVSIREGKPINEGARIAESTLSAIMGRMSAYTGRLVPWNWVMNTSKLDLTPPQYELGDLPVEPVAVPGKTQLI